MQRREHNKLVRDRIPEIIAAEGREYAIETMGEDEYRNALLVKLVEEAQEASEAGPSELVTEIADLYEVIDTLIRLHGLEREKILAEQVQRRNKRGGFAKRIKLLWTEEQ